MERKCASEDLCGLRGGGAWKVGQRMVCGTLDRDSKINIYNSFSVVVLTVCDNPFACFLQSGCDAARGLLGPLQPDAEKPCGGR